MEDFQMRDTVEGDAIRRVLMESSRLRASRNFSRRYVESPKDKDQSPERVAEQNEDSRAVTVNGSKYHELVRETAREGADDDANTEQDSQSSSLTILQWVGTLLIGISILLTWPIAVAYMRG
ncbi:hypothetical protein PF004_g23762 [Phytophthora fragariae]|uniref:Uncharacterized protein n=1 Tax=Phytophthora fragariae TaxID=53985 RepID=A0A6G0MW50_9STRA|nr:hypothetical protein PF004_g23762 [Phytophthora fragariae]